MAVLRLQVNTGSSFLVRRLQKITLEVADVSELIAAKLRSPLVFCPRCPEGHHTPETICFPPQAADSTTLAIMVQRLEGRIVDLARFAFLDVCAVAQYLLITEEYSTPYLPRYMTDGDTCTSPTTLKGIELLYVAGYQSLAKHLYFLACCRMPPRTMAKAYELFPDLFRDTDFFGDL